MRILNLVSLLEFEKPELFERRKFDEILTISPLLNKTPQIRCEIGSLSYVLAMICLYLELGDDLDALDGGYLSGESNVGDEEIEREFYKAHFDAILVDKNLIEFDENRRNLEISLARISAFFDAKIIDFESENELKFNDGKFDEFKELQSFDGAVIFKHSCDLEFKGGRYFTAVTKLKDGQNCEIKGKTLNEKAKFVLDENIKGTVAFLGLESFSGYKFELAKVKGI